MNLHSIWNAHHSVWFGFAWFGFGFKLITVDVDGEMDKEVNDINILYNGFGQAEPVFFGRFVFSMDEFHFSGV